MKIICILSMLFAAFGCTRSDPQLRIIIAYDGVYLFSKPARLTINLVQHTYDGPSFDVGNLPFTITKLPQTLDVDKTSIPLEDSNSLVASIDSEEGEMKFITFEDHLKSEPKVIRLITREDLGMGYSRDSSGVYSMSKRLPDCDPKTFSFIGTDGLFVRDAARVYRGSRLIQEADAASFAAINRVYQRDARQIFYDGTLLENADRATFETIDEEGFARDKSKIYSWGRAIEGVDRITFEPLDRFYSRDARNGYFQQEAIPESDGQSFRLISGSDGYASDATSVFQGKRKLTGADPDKFHTINRDINNQAIPGYYATDGTLVFYQGDLIPGADAASFQVESISQSDGFSARNHSAKDKNRRYQGKVPI